MIVSYNDNKIIKEVPIIKSVIVRVSEDIHSKLKIKVVQNKTSIQEVLENFIINYVNENDETNQIK